MRSVGSDKVMRSLPESLLKKSSVGRGRDARTWLASAGGRWMVGGLVEDDQPQRVRFRDDERGNLLRPRRNLEHARAVTEALAKRSVAP